MKLKRKILYMALMAVTLMSNISTSASVNGNIEILANNGMVKFNSEAEPINIDGRVLVPVKYIGDTFGAVTDIDTINGVITSRAKGNVIEFNMGSNIYKVKAKEKEMDTTPLVHNNTIYLPLRYAFEIFNVEVVWDKANRTIIVNENAKDLAEYTEYSYSLSGNLKGDLKFRSSYDSGVSMVPSDSYRGVEGDTLLKIVIDETKTDENSIEDINKVLEGVGSNLVINTGESGYNEYKVEGNLENYTSYKRFGDYYEIIVKDSGTECNVERTNQTRAQGYGDVVINKENYKQLLTEDIDIREGTMLKLKSGNSLVLGKENESNPVLIVDRRFYTK